MYGSDTSQAATLAVTGTALGVAGHLLAAAVIVLAGLALLTTVNVIRARRHRRWVETHRGNKYQAEAVRRMTALLAEVERLRAEAARWKHAYEMADPLLTERDRLAATVERVRKVMNSPEVVNIHAGGGNLVGQKKVIFPEHLRAAIERTNS